MAEEKDESQKTEDPTQKRLSDAREKGDAPKSQEVTIWFAMASATAAMAFLSGGAVRSVSQSGARYFQGLDEFTLNAESAQALAARMMDMVSAVGLIVIALMIAAVLGNILQQMPVISAEKMKPELNKLSPLKGAKRLFGTQGWVNFGKGLAKLTIIGVVLFMVMWPERGALAPLIETDLDALLPFVRTIALRMMIAVLMALGLIAALDYAYQKFEYLKRQRMTKQEVKDEHKQSEGDPQVKAKIRQVRMERARTRMMAAVPEATVVVTNPTHYAVALKYEQGQASAPLCVAKGVDAIALKIREVAEEAKVPIVENPPLARALYAGVELEEEIPLEHYKAVAKIIGHIYRLARKRGRRS